MLIQSDAYNWLFVLSVNNIVSLLKVFVQEILSNVLFLSVIKLLSQHAHYSLLIIWNNESWCNQNKQLKKNFHFYQMSLAQTLNDTFQQHKLFLLLFTYAVTSCYTA